MDIDIGIDIDVDVNRYRYNGCFYEIILFKGVWAPLQGFGVYISRFGIDIPATVLKTGDDLTPNLRAAVSADSKPTKDMDPTSGLE